MDIEDCNNSACGVPVTCKYTLPIEASRMFVSRELIVETRWEFTRVFGDAASASSSTINNEFPFTKDEEAKVLYHCNKTLEFFFNTIIAGFTN